MITYEQTMQEIILLNKISESTKKLYEIAHNQYTTYHNMTWAELIQEAEEDENNIIKINKRRIKDRLQQFIYYLLEQNKSTNTITSYLTRIIKMYKTNDIEVPSLKYPRKDHEETYEDLPSREEIRKVMQNTSTKNKALISFIASSGLSIVEVASLTFRDFHDATSEYHDKTENVLEFLLALEGKSKVIPTWHVQRRKTKVSHVTFNSPEATRYIVEYAKELVLSEEVRMDDKLFNYSSKKGVGATFARLNDKHRLGWTKTRRRFHAHALRSFFATTLTSRGVSYLTTEFLLGHSIDSTRSAYYKADVEHLRREYVQVLPYLSFLEVVRTVSLDDDERRELSELKEYKRVTEKRMLRLEEAVRTLTL